MNICYTNTVAPYSLLEYNNYEHIKQMAMWALDVGDKQSRLTNVKADMSDWQVWSDTDLFNNFLNFLSKEIIYLPWVEKDFKLTFVNAWTAVYRKGDFTRIHDHTPSYLSFVLCLDDGGEVHPLIFSDNNTPVELMTGRIVVFPSYVRHHVPVYYGKSHRIVLAGNIEVVNE